MFEQLVTGLTYLSQLSRNFELECICSELLTVSALSLIRVSGSTTYSNAEVLRAWKDLLKHPMNNLLVEAVVLYLIVHHVGDEVGLRNAWVMTASTAWPSLSQPL